MKIKEQTKNKNLLLNNFSTNTFNIYTTILKFRVGNIFKNVFERSLMLTKGTFI